MRSRTVLLCLSLALACLAVSADGSVVKSDLRRRKKIRRKVVKGEDDVTEAANEVAEAVEGEEEEEAAPVSAKNLEDRNARG